MSLGLNTNCCFWTANLDLAAAHFNNSFPDNAKTILKYADLACDNKFIFHNFDLSEASYPPISFNGNINWEHKEQGNNIWNNKFIQHEFLPILGKAWRITKNDKYPQAAISLWNNIFENAIKPDYSLQPKNHAFRYIN